VKNEQNIDNDPSTVVQPRKKTMSEAALAANRANAKKCTGPKTREGKFKASLNALKLGLYCHVFIIKTEDAGIFENFFKSYIDEFQPTTPSELEHLEYQKPSFARQEAHEIRLASLFQRTLARLHSIGDKKIRNETKFARDRLSFAA